MAKSLTITYDDKEYVLEYTRTVVKNTERMGFDVDLIGAKPVIMIPLLVSAAFVKNHEKLKPGKVDEIYRSIDNKDEFLHCLVEMYQETVMDAVLNEPEEQSKNSSWAANWERTTND